MKRFVPTGDSSFLLQIVFCHPMHSPPAAFHQNFIQNSKTLNKIKYHIIRIASEFINTVSKFLYTQTSFKPTSTHIHHISVRILYLIPVICSSLSTFILHYIVVILYTATLSSEFHPQVSTNFQKNIHIGTRLHCCLSNFSLNFIWTFSFASITFPFTTLSTPFSCLIHQFEMETIRILTDFHWIWEQVCF